MERSKLIKLFRCLSKQEVEKFGKFIVGQGCRKSSYTFGLYTYLKQHFPDIEGNIIQKELVYKTIMPNNKAYNDRQMRNLMLKLSNYLEEYLLLLELRENEQERELLMLEVLKKRGQDELFFKQAERLKKQWKKKPIQGRDRYFYEYKVQELICTHENFMDVEQKAKLIYEFLISLDHYYFGVKLYYSICIPSMELIYKNPSLEIFLIDEIQKFSKRLPFSENKLIEIFTLSLEAFNNNDYSNYDVIKQKYKENYDVFNIVENYDLNGFFLKTYCFTKHVEHKEGLKEAFEIHRFLAEKELHIVDGVVGFDRFLAAVQSACFVEKTEWARNFIEKYKVYLHDDLRDNIVLFSEAKVALEEKNYELCLKKIQNLYLENIGQVLIIKVDQFKCYYELEGYEEVFFNAVNAFKVFISRTDKVTEKVQKRFNKFIYLANKLKKAQLNKVSEETLDKWWVELQEDPPPAHKRWLKEKLNELRKTL